MDLLTAILACSLYWDDDLVRAMAESNSRGNPYAVVDGAATLDDMALDTSPPPRSLDAALASMGAIVSRGGSPLLGWMQVPVSWAEVYGKPRESLLDPCTNLEVGTARLSEFDYECARDERPGGSRRGEPPDHIRRFSASRRICITQKYASAIGMPEFERVVSLELRFQGSMAARAPNILARPAAEPAHAPSGSSWAGRRLFFGVTNAEPTLVSPFDPAGPAAPDPFEITASPVLRPSAGAATSETPTICGGGSSPCEPRP
jgi:hypothetical protein